MDYEEGIEGIKQGKEEEKQNGERGKGRQGTRLFSPLF